MSIKVEAYQVAESFNLRKLRGDFRATVNSGNASELFYSFDAEQRYLLIFDYGVVVFANYDDLAKSEFLRFVKSYAEDWLDKDLNEEYTIEIDEKLSRNVVKNDLVIVKELTPSVLRIVMLNVGQSVALEFYENRTTEMLNATKKYTLDLESRGKLSASKKDLLKFIGGVLNVRNSIVDNLYILDDPNLVWDDEDLNQLNRNLKSNFDSFARFKDLDYRLQTVENNLRIFTDVLNHRESQFLELIVILLILTEIINALFFHK